MARVKLKYVTSDRDRHGNVRFYFRRRGMARKFRLPGLPGSEDFMAAYRAALAGSPAPATEDTPARPPVIKGTDSFEWLCDRYRRSPEFTNNLTEVTQTRRAQMLTSICAEPLSDARPVPIGRLPYDQITAKAIRRLRDRRADRPNGANNMMKALKVLMKWAVEADYLDHNPAKDVPLIEVHSEGYHTWTVDEVRQFEARHPVGSKARLALALMLYTGQRRSDIIRFGRQHVRGDILTFTQAKNKARKPVTLTLNILPPLARIIEATPSSNLTFLETAHGRPFTGNGIGNKFREWCDQAGLPHCTAHGLRKAGATIAAERGATEKQLMAIFGWSTLAQVQNYTRRASQAKLAAGAMHYLDFDENETETNVSHRKRQVESGGTISAKTALKSGS
jgi:integrase